MFDFGETAAYKLAHCPTLTTTTTTPTTATMTTTKATGRQEKEEKTKNHFFPVDLRNEFR